MTEIRNLFLNNRFFYVFGGITGLFVLSYAFSFLFVVAQSFLLLAVLVLAYEIYFSFRTKNLLQAKRILPKALSLGDENKIELLLVNRTSRKLELELIDELPEQFQIRDFHLSTVLDPEKEKSIQYSLNPKERGEYHFGALNVFIHSPVGLIQRRIVIPLQDTVSVYPSVIQMKKYNLHAMVNMNAYNGIKKIRRIGHSYEFEQIRNYVTGDDYRSINWKASSRRGDLMVNQYTEEKSQRIYTIIDKSRAMKMPFNDLSLLDYAINSSLVLANVAIQKHDKAGLITFSDKIDSMIKADSTSRQMHRIMQALYKEKEHHLEANYELLYQTIKTQSEGRSLLVLFTNFESQYAMQRILPILRMLNHSHLLLVVFFENTELLEFGEENASTVLDIYQTTMAKKLITEKEMIVQELNNHGIQAIKTTPEELSVNTVNKYLELKARGLI